VTLDDVRLAKASRALRRKLGRTQSDVAGAGHSRRTVSAIESGRASELRLSEVRNHFSRLGATVRVSAWWEGAALDRLIDERHATVVDALVGRLLTDEWQVATEVSFSEFGERGSIDVLAARNDCEAVFVGEAKSDWGSLEETLRRIAVKARLASTIAERRFGFAPRVLGVALVFPEDRTARRVAQRFAATLDAAYPARNPEVKRWIREPSGHMRGIWFLSSVPTVGQARKRPG
jgi:hypothetical protein